MSIKIAQVAHYCDINACAIIIFRKAYLSTYSYMLFLTNFEGSILTYRITTKLEPTWQQQKITWKFIVTREN